MLKRDLHPGVQCSIIHISPDMETTFSGNRCMDKENVVVCMMEFSHIEEGNPAIYDNMDGLLGY